MTTLNNKILTTLNILTEYGFVCQNESKLALFKSLQENVDYIDSEKTIHEIILKHKDCFSFAHFKVDYKSTFNRTIKSVKFLISDDKFGYPTTTNRFVNVTNKEDVISKRITAVLANQKLKDNTKKIELERFPVVTKELQSIFGNVNIEMAKLGGNVFLKYKEHTLSFSLHATAKSNDLSLYKTTLQIESNKKSFLTAQSIKNVIDLIQS